MVYGVQDPNAMYNKYGINGFYNQYGLYNNNQSPSIFGNGYNQGNGDDGKISFGEKVGSFFKGIGKSIVNGVKSIFTPKGLLKTALTVGACMIPGIGPVIGMGLAVAGVAKGASTVLKGAAQASAATTDAEAKAAWENIGGGAFTTAASVAGVKGAAKAIGNMNKAAAASGGVDVSKATGLAKAKGTLQNAKTTFDKSSLGKSVTKVTTAYKNGDKLTGKLKDAGTAAKEELKTGYTSVKDKYTASKTATKAAKDAADDIKNVDSKTAAKKDFVDEYQYDTATGKYTSKKGGEALEVDAYKAKVKEYDASIADAKHSTASSVKKASKNTQNAKNAQNEFSNKYDTSKEITQDGVVGFKSKDGEMFISKENYTKQSQTLAKNVKNAEKAYDASKTGYEQARKATQTREQALKVKETEISSAKKLTDAQARKEATQAANDKFNKTIESEVAKVKNQAAKDALRGETSMTKNIFGGFKRGTVANNWDTKGASSMALANHLEEANSEYEMYNQYLQSVANSNTGYSA
ncbi:hypothetical protein IJC60_04310 [bacterium]|nr:hypothetical protein [bacterium]